MAGDEVFGVATMVLQWGIIYPEGKVPVAQEANRNSKYVYTLKIRQQHVF